MTGFSNFLTELYIIALANLKEFIQFGTGIDTFPSLTNLVENWSNRILEGVGRSVIKQQT